MKKLSLIIPMLALSVLMTAATKPLRVVVLGDDPMMASDEAAGAVGYAALLQQLFDEQVTVEVQASATLLPDDPAALLEYAQKGDVALVCKQPVDVLAEDKIASDIYLNQLIAIAQAAKKKGVKIVWLTPVAPRYFTAEGAQVHRMGIFPDVVRRMCKRDALQCIDVEQITFDWIATAGMDSTAAAFLPVQPATPLAASKVAREGNLLTAAGAQQVATLIGEAIRADKQSILNKRLR